MKPTTIRSISEFHSLFHLAKPELPQISIVDYTELVADEIVTR